MELNKSRDMYQILISGYRLANVSHGKPYHVYIVEMIDLHNGFRYLIEKRYSEFNTLHRMVIFFFYSYCTDYYSHCIYIDISYS
jgi:hypothetical protein